MVIVNSSLLYETTSSITDISGDFSDLTLWVFWKETGVLKTKCLFKPEVVDKDGVYLGFINDGRWSPVTELTISPDEDESPSILMSDNEVSAMAFSRDGELYYAPQIISKYIRAADCTLTTKIDSGTFTVDLANKDGIFTKGDYADLFENEKSVGLEMGYNDEFVRIATSQADSSSAERSRSESTFSLTTENKFYDLLQMTMTKNYSRKFTAGIITTMIEGYALTDILSAGATGEVRIDSPNGKRWAPGSVTITNLTSGFSASDVYGQTEFFAFVRITNNNTSAAAPTFDVRAHDISSTARKVGNRVTVTGERITLSGTTAVRLAHKNVDGTMVAYPSVLVNDVSYSNGTDYELALDSSGYPTIARTEDSSIPDESTVTVGYTYISTYTFSLSFSGSKEAQGFVNLYPYSQPESYQMVITGVSSGTATDYLKNYRPLHIFYTSATNGAGTEIILNTSAKITVYFEIWARPLETEQSFGGYMTVKEIFRDLVKLASHKDIMFYEYTDGNLKDGQFTSLDDNGEDLFFEIEEEYDVDTLRIENTGTDDVNITILEAGYILDNDGNYNYGVRVAVTRAYYSALAVDYSFQIWGQYTDRKDFLPPFALEMDSISDTELTAPLQLKDVTVEEAMRKLLQICYYDGCPYKIYAGDRGQIKVTPYKSARLDHISHTFKARNMAEITKKRQIPLVIDRVQVKGSITSLYLVESEIELAHNQNNAFTVAAGSKHAYLQIDFDKLYDMNSYEFRNVWTHRCHLQIVWKTPSAIYLKLHNDSKSKLGKNNNKSGSCTFELWAKPISTANYQEEYVYKTNPNIGGKFTYSKGEIDNELIINSTIGAMVADSVITESCQDYLYLQPKSCPAHPGLEQIDTVKTVFEEFGDSEKGIIQEIEFSFDGTKPPKLTMNAKMAPRIPFAAGYGASNLAFYDDDSLYDDDLIGVERDETKKFYNLIFG